MWLADDLESGDSVAMKVLRPLERGERYDRFVAEVRTCLEVLPGWPNVLPVLDARLTEDGETKSAPWMAMPVASPLVTHLGSAPSVEAVVDALLPIARVLADLLDQHGVSHRDIKPENLYWHQNAPAIGDFGLVQVPERTNITREDRDLGPRRTLPPEMRANQPTREGPPADVFELASTIFLLVTGDAPPGGLRPDEHSHQLAQRFSRSDLRELDGVLQNATRYDPASRPTMRQLAGDLAAWRTPPAPPGSPDPSSYRARLARIRPQKLIDDAARREVWDSTVQGYAERLHGRAKPTFDFLNALGLEPVSTALQLFDHLDDARRPIRSGSSLTFGPPAAEGAMWFAGGFSWGWTEVGASYITAGWVVAPFDKLPYTVWASSVVVNPALLTEARLGEDLIDQWASGAESAVDIFITEAQRLADAPLLGPGGSTPDPPRLEYFDLSAFPVPGGRRQQVTATARIVAGTAGVASTGNSLPSHANLNGPSGESLILLFSSDGNLVCGTRSDGYYQSTVWIEPYHPDGVWVIDYMYLVDRAGHQAKLFSTELGELPWTFTVEVQR